MSPTDILEVTKRKRNHLRIVNTVSTYRFQLLQALQRLRIICWNYYECSKYIFILRNKADAVAVATTTLATSGSVTLRSYSLVRSHVF